MQEYRMRMKDDSDGRNPFKFSFDRLGDTGYLNFQGINGRGKAIHGYLNGLFGEGNIIASNNFSVDSCPNFRMVGKENIIDAVKIILTSDNSFLDVTEDYHKKIFNKLIDYAESLSGESLGIDKCDLTENSEKTKLLSGASHSAFYQPVPSSANSGQIQQPAPQQPSDSPCCCTIF